ncbi:hypothetical protein ACJX0J_017243, partial [Zea mays]
YVPFLMFFNCDFIWYNLLGASVQTILIAAFGQQTRTTPRGGRVRTDMALWTAVSLTFTNKQRGTCAPLDLSDSLTH